MPTKKRQTAIVNTGRIAPTSTNEARGPTSATNAVAAIEPRPTAPITSPQVSPSTRVRTSSGTIRCNSVKPATSSMLFAAPMTASRTTAAAKFGQTAVSAIGTPQKMSAMPSGTASRLPSSRIAVKAPNRPPTPSAAVR